MAQQTQAIEAPALPLNACSVAEHCEALRKHGRLPFWWYLARHPLWGNYSRPFQDRSGGWWYQVKPGLCWAADFLTPLSAQQVRLPLSKSYLGFQHVVPAEEEANSHLVINAITDLGAYSERVIDAKRRNAIRKGLRSCTLEVVSSYHEPTVEQCRLAWKGLTERTGWKHAQDRGEFHSNWRERLQVPGRSIIVGRDLQSGEVAGFLLTKIIGNTAYVDTIASRTDLLRCNVNDALMFAFLMNARQLPGVTKAHYAIRSYVETLEHFKRALGFKPVPFPARVVLRGAAGSVLKRLSPTKYRRMFGLFDDSAPDPSPADAPGNAGHLGTPST